MRGARNAHVFVNVKADIWCYFDATLINSDIVWYFGVILMLSWWGEVGWGGMGWDGGGVGSQGVPTTKIHPQKPARAPRGRRSHQISSPSNPPWATGRPNYQPDPDSFPNILARPDQRKRQAQRQPPTEDHTADPKARPQTAAQDHTPTTPAQPPPRTHGPKQPHRHTLPANGVIEETRNNANEKTSDYSFLSKWL